MEISIVNDRRGNQRVNAFVPRTKKPISSAVITRTHLVVRTVESKYAWNGWLTENGVTLISEPGVYSERSRQQRFSLSGRAVAAPCFRSGNIQRGIIPFSVVARSRKDTRREKAADEKEARLKWPKGKRENVGTGLSSILRILRIRVKFDHLSFQFRECSSAKLKKNNFRTRERRMVSIAEAIAT